MKEATRNAAQAFTAQFEGVVPEMYTDVRGLVTVATGNLIDPAYTTLKLGWIRRSDGALATESEILAEWGQVKSNRLAWSPNRAKRPIYLPDEAISALFLGRLNKNETYLARRWLGWDGFCADLQLCLHSCAWAAGPAWAAPHLDVALARGDWWVVAGQPGNPDTDPEARGECWLRDGAGMGCEINPGLRPRNRANRILAKNAAVVAARGFSPDVLYWPTELDG